MKIGNLSSCWPLSMRPAFAGIICLMAAAGCSEDSSPEENTAVYEGVVRPVGAEVSAAEFFEVGTDGGTLRSGDGVIEIKIPAGALSDPATVGIQLVENTAPQGVGYSYRLTPEDLSFAKPVAITFSYAATPVSWADGLGVACQHDDGIWYWPGNAAHDRSQKKVSAETTHFSDWSLFESMYLTPSEAIVIPGGEIEVVASRVLPEQYDEDLLTPLVLEVPVPLPESVPLEPAYIRRWDFVGGGVLTPSGNTAVYTAPDEIPETNPATITLEVDLGDGSKALLLSYISVAGCEIIMDGGRYSKSTFTSKHTAMPVYIAEEDLNIISFYGEAGDAKVLVRIMYPGKEPRKVAWTEETCYVITTQVFGELPVEGSHMALELDPPTVHNGFVTIFSYDEETGIIVGEFAGGVTFAELCGGDYCYTPGTIEGTFVASMY